MAYETIQKLLRESDVAFTRHTHAPITTVEEAQERFHLGTTNLLKTVVFKIKDGDWILVGVQGAARIHYKKLADALGIRRKHLRPVASGVVETELGFEIGGVGPFPVRPDIQILFDTDLQTFETIVCGGGRNTETLEMAFTDLLHLTHGRVADVTRGPD